MKNTHIGMFIEQNKDLLLPEDLLNAQKALYRLPDKKVKSLMSIKTKSPICNFLFATFFGWIGADSFYLGQTSVGVGRIITTLLNIAIYLLPHFAFTQLAGDIFVWKFFISAPILQYGSLAISIAFSIVYFAKLMINIFKAVTNAKLANKQLYNIRFAPVTVIENGWLIG